MERRIVEYFGELGRLPHGAERVWSAHRYLQQARKLRMISSYPGEFLGERLLNLYKMLESMFATRSVDELRAYLDKLEVPEDAREFICSLVFVRDQLDAGHVALHALEPNEYTIVHRFAERAEDAATWLLLRVVRMAAARKFDLPGSESKTDRSKLIAQLAKRDDLLISPYQQPDIKHLRKS